MNYIKFMASFLMLALFMNCNNKDNGGGQTNGDGAGSGDPKPHATAAEAATAAKADMLAAMDKGITFGLDKEKLRTAVPGEAMPKMVVDFNALLNVDSAASFEKMTSDAGATIVPLVNGPEVVTVIGLQNDNQQFKVAMLGERQVSTELDQMAKAGATQGQRITIIEVPNLQATIYQIISPERGAMYFTSYNNSSLSQPMSADRLIPMLRADAQVFQREYGDKIKANQLVR